MTKNNYTTCGQIGAYRKNRSDLTKHIHTRQLVFPSYYLIAFIYNNQRNAFRFSLIYVNHASLYLQGVVKIRKRVTLMVFTVSTIFAICWVSDGVIYILSYYSTSNRPNDVTYAVAFTLVLFNSAVNPFVYALVNHRFREKMKAMLCCTCRHSNRIQTTSTSHSHESNSTQLNNISHPTQTVE